MHNIKLEAPQHILVFHSHKIPSKNPFFSFTQSVQGQNIGPLKRVAIRLTRLAQRLACSSGPKFARAGKVPSQRLAKQRPSLLKRAVLLACFLPNIGLARSSGQATAWARSMKENAFPMHFSDPFSLPYTSTFVPWQFHLHLDPPWSPKDHYFKSIHH